MYKKILSLTLFLLLFLNCSPDKTHTRDTETDLSQIKERGKLVVLTGYSATSYFIYRGQPMGYEYELMQRLGNHLGVEVEIRIARDMDKILEILNEGQGDIVAAALTITKERTEKVAFTLPTNTVSIVLVQRKPDKWRQMKLHEIDRLLIKNPIDLIGKIIHVRRESSYYARLVNLAEEIGGDIEIVEVSGITSTEELIRKVSSGEIEYTVADDNIANINQAYYDNIDVSTALSMPQRIGLAIRKSSPELLNAVNTWLEAMKDSADYYVIYNRYFKNRRAFSRRGHSPYFSHSGGGISQWDTTIQENAERLGWDWRLLASQIYQESHFDPQVKSWAGAVGLMQLMPATAREFGATDLMNPNQSIEVGVNYLKWLDDYWMKEITDSTERIRFVLGSYNAGYNHVEDARRLAEKFDRKKNVWEDNVAYYLLRKSNKAFFNDEVVKFGYCRGEEPVKYVHEILARYEHYLKLLQ
ncbi:MAG: transporter substrate-binding domain-containing protein [Calditrichaeota bacterium]|nr:transporter substrate-binding domain-containing protein [Calditrichota bacterium]